YLTNRLINQSTNRPSEGPLFIIYTSVSTGKPEGVIHTTGGYLLNAAATLKSVFDYNEGDIVVAKHKITQFYTAPTAIHLLHKFGREYVDLHDLSSLRVIDTAGCRPVRLPPFFGIALAILNPDTGEEIETTEAEGVLAIRQPWPSMARTIYNNHNQYLDTYMRLYKGYYFTGNGAGRDHDGYYWIRGRVDDVINISAFAFVTLKPNSDYINVKYLILQVRKSIGPLLHQKRFLPKTRSEKIMRSILLKIVEGQTDSLDDLSTLDIVDTLIEEVKN
ncbi:96_t:CDS:2, partial [Dentiscutata erythropus]